MSIMEKIAAAVDGVELEKDAVGPEWVARRAVKGLSQRASKIYSGAARNQGELTKRTREQVGKVLGYLAGSKNKKALKAISEPLRTSAVVTPGRGLNIMGALTGATPMISKTKKVTKSIRRGSAMAKRK